MESWAAGPGVAHPDPVLRGPPPLASSTSGLALWLFVPGVCKSWYLVVERPRLVCFGSAVALLLWVLEENRLSNLRGV